MRVIVSGALANKPYNGGNAWSRLNWLLGLRRLGCDVHFIEQLAARPGDRGYADGLAFFKQLAQAFDLQDCMTLVGPRGAIEGRSNGELHDFAQHADLLVNISGHLTLEYVKGAVRRRMYFDDDPGYTQFWHANGQGGARLAGHDWYFTIGCNIGRPSSSIPTGGTAWRTMRPLVVLSEWPAVKTQRLRRFTTVASWRGPYGPVVFGGQTYGLKVHEFRKYLALPERVKPKFELALSIDEADCKDRQSLEQHGWQLMDPATVASTPQAYRDYIQQSDAEFSVAQGIYVETHSGWFSDRTACYLASGKPALVQDTGLAGLNVGEGLVTFSTLDEAIAGAERIAGDYDRHCQAARGIAEEHLDSDRVLTGLFEQMGMA